MTTKEDLAKIAMVPSNHNHKGSMSNNNNKPQSKTSFKLYTLS
jgi:hypothetical protein